MVSDKPRFKDRSLFGKKWDAAYRETFAAVTKMYSDGKILDDGKLDPNASYGLDELWSYVYYLFKYNKDRLEVFKKMKTKTGNSASARFFYRTVQEHTNTTARLTPQNIRAFLNDVIEQHHPRIPLLEKSAKKSACKGANLESKLEQEHSVKRKLQARIRELESKSAAVPSPFLKKIEAYEQKIYSLEQELQKLRDVIGNKTVSSKDIKEIIEVLEAPKPDCTADIVAFRNDVRRTVESVVLGKMCVIKYLADILNVSNSELYCDQKQDLTTQIENFRRLPAPKQHHFKQVFAKTKNEIKKSAEDLGAMSLAEIQDCSALENSRAKYASQLASLKGLLSNLSSLSEDLYGSIRTYIKMRKFIPAIDNKNAKINFEINDNRVINIGCNGLKTSATMFGAFDENYTNADMYSGVLGTVTNGLKIEAQETKPWSLSKTFEQLNQGTSLFIAGYGYSGSGKTYGLFGGKDEPGIIHYGLANLENIADISIDYVFELYYDHLNVNERKMRTKVIIGYDRVSNLTKQLAKHGVENVQYDPISLKKDTIKETSALNDFINESMKAITDHQKKASRIKRTLNNDQSSRSHLFVVFNIKNTQGQPSYLTACDLGGAENALGMYNAMFASATTLPYFMMQFESNGKYKGVIKGENIGKYMNKNLGITNGTQVLKKGDVGKLEFGRAVSPRIEDTLQKNVQVILESFFIVESLLHMRYYLNKRNGIKTSFDLQQITAGNIVYRTDRVFVKPEEEENSETRKQINMIGILKFIEELGKENTMSKFILFGALRQDKCEDNIATVNYLASVSSTS